MDFPELFSKRSKAPFGALRADIPTSVRKRLLNQLGQLSEDRDQLMSRIATRLLDRYGEFSPPLDEEESDPIYSYFLKCETENVLDFIESIFQCSAYPRHVGALVTGINRIFREDEVGYELTPMTILTRQIASKIPSLGNMRIQQTIPDEITYPIIRHRGDTPQEDNMTECLTLLAAPSFRIANGQFLKAHQHYRKSEWDQAIAYCGSSFESVLKAALTAKGTTFDEKASANPLIQACVRAGIFPQVYENSLIGVANIRNAMSDATHGRSSDKFIAPTQANVEHLLYTTAASIVFVAKSVPS